MSGFQIYRVKRIQGDMRLDKMLCEVYESATFGLVQKLCRKGQIRLDGKRVKGNERVAFNQEVKIPHALTQQGEKKKHVPLPLTKLQRKEVKDWIITENDDMVVLNKPYGLPVQAGSGHHKSIDRMLGSYYLEDEAADARLVHRLDKTTTGCLLLAKTKEAAKEFAKLFQSRKVEKVYWAVVYGKIRKREGVIKSFLSKETEDDGYEKMESAPQVDDGIQHYPGKKIAETSYRIIDSAGFYHWLEVRPKTGRMHQIRVHLAELGAPIVGDIKYGGEKLHNDLNIKSDEVFLHARELHIAHGKKEDVFVAPMPVHFRKLFKLFEWNEKDA